MAGYVHRRATLVILSKDLNIKRLMSVLIYIFIVCIYLYIKQGLSCHDDVGLNDSTIIVNISL